MRNSDFFFAFMRFVVYPLLLVTIFQRLKITMSKKNKIKYNVEVDVECGPNKLELDVLYLNSNKTTINAFWAQKCSSLFCCFGNDVTNDKCIQ